MSFKKKKVKSKTLGEYLRESREYSGLALPDIAKLSQVQPKFILALEEGRYGALPDPVYVKGFLKSLARIFHAAPDQLLTQYLNEYEVAKNIAAAKPDATRNKFFAPRFILSPKILVIAGLALLGLFSAAYLYFQVISLKRPPRLTILSPHENLTTDADRLEVKGKTEPGSTVYLNNQSIVADAKGEFHENLSLAPGSNFLTIRAVNKFGQSATVIRTIVYSEKDIAGVSTGTSEILSPENLEVEIVMGGEAAWISITVDGLPYYEGTMLQYARRKVTALEKVVLTTGNAGTTKVVLNGKDLGFLGKDGEVIKDIEFTK